MSPPEPLAVLRDEVVGCRRCPRLVDFRERVARERKREFRDETYWGRPVPGFGDPQARLVVVGLAPAAHGSNRTGRVFTGDRSAAFLVRAFFDVGFANQPTSTKRADGLRYTDLFLTAAVRCVPPDNQPKPGELQNCLPFLVREFQALTETRAYLALGGFAWGATLEAASRCHGVPRPTIPFGHGACAVLGPGLPLVYGSYHPSPQNTNTGRLSPTMMVGLLRTIREGYGGRSGGRER
ncbi:MAG: uracil-DNA glycosylase [Thermoplasmata archaeon]|nr:uracil-DNA glycosylase [Thermoplasmata archaeon]